MRIVALIGERAVIERILRHLGLWAQRIRVSPSTGPPEPVPGECLIEPLLEDPFPDYDTEPACRELAEPVMAYANG